jgi:hypothetical protein
MFDLPKPYLRYLYLKEIMLKMLLSTYDSNKFREDSFTLIVYESENI